MSIQEMALQMPRAEKIRLMEALWMDLSRSEADYESPSWHETALKETEARVMEGMEELVDWNEAKRRLRA